MIIGESKNLKFERYLSKYELNMSYVMSNVIKGKEVK